MSSLNATDTTDTLIATVDLGIFGPGCRVGVPARDGEIVDGVFVEKLELGDTSDMDSDDLEGAAIDAGQLVLAAKGYRLTSRWEDQGGYFTARVTPTTTRGTERPGCQPRSTGITTSR